MPDLYFSVQVFWKLCFFHRTGAVKDSSSSFVELPEIRSLSLTLNSSLRRLTAGTGSGDLSRFLFDDLSIFSGIRFYELILVCSEVILRPDIIIEALLKLQIPFILQSFRSLMLILMSVFM